VIVECDCKGWKKYIPIIDGALTFQQIRYSITVDNKIVFKYCPYCGKILKELL